MGKQGAQPVSDRLIEAEAVPVAVGGALDRQQALRRRFAAELARLNVSLHQVDDPARAAGVVAALTAGAAGGRPVLVWDDPLLAGLGVVQALAQAGVEAVVWRTGESGISAGEGGGRAARELAAQAAVGITTAHYAVAATGTLALASGPGRGRSVSLLPWVHVAVVDERVLVPTVEELFERLAASQELPSSVALVTGPSRSADIENDLSIGVHGPGELHVVLLCRPEPDPAGGLPASA